MKTFRTSAPYPPPSLLKALCAIALIPTLLIAGCARLSPKKPVEIVYWTGWSGHEFEAQERLVEEFNRTHSGVHVRILSQFGTSGYQKVRIAFAGGATPDLMSTVWADELAAYALRGVLTPLDDYLAKSGRDVEREYTPGVAKMLRIGGATYGLTVTTNTSFIAYNRAIFREAGLDPDRPPTTIEELDKAALACTKYDSQGSFLRYGFRPSQLSLWAYAFGGKWYDSKTGRVTANDPRNLAALRWMASYARSYDLKKMQAFQAGFGSNETANGPFFVGKMAMWSTGEWSEEFIRRYAPNLDWGWFALPSPPGGRANATGAGGSVFVIPAACRHKAEAWEFLNWMSSPRAVASFCKSVKNVPPVVAAAKEDPFFQTDPLFRFAIKVSQGENSFGAPPIPIWPAYSREIGRVEEAAMLGGEDPEKLLNALQARMEKELRETAEDLRR